jgi:hypothetical protein
MQNIDSSGSYKNLSDSDQYGKFYRMRELDEIRGLLSHLEVQPEGLSATIANVHVLLPAELEENLRSLVSKKIGVLRLDGYRIRIL